MLVRGDVPREEIQLNALLGHSEDATVRFLMSPAIVIILVAVFFDVDPAVVGHAAAVDLLDDGRVFDLAILVRRCQASWKSAEQVLDMGRAPPCAGRGRHG